MASETRERMQEAVHALRTSVADSDLAILADAATGLVLCSDVDSPLPHDALERIAEDARADMGAAYVTAAADNGKPVSVTRIDAKGWTVTLRTGGAEEILVCRCPQAPDRAALDAAAKAVFDLLRSDGEGSA